ncbi:MAG: threonine--tRNA ligase, partial [Anaerolineae bacterium]|nr:threonine--tRNA ligase [Anaerolineae bacterium]
MAQIKERYEDTLLYRIRHSSAHVMADAVLSLFPTARFAIGPAIEDGFYYDFELPRTLTPEDLQEIEKRMVEIIKGNYPFQRRSLSADEARQVFKDQPFKLELIDGLEQGGVDEHGNPLDEKPEISTFTHHNFTDLCRGPHVESTNQINPKAIKLMNVSGAYWRGDEKRPMLQRIYGTAWMTAEELQTHLDRLEEAKKRDHRKLGKELEIFTFDEEVGPGLPLWLPRGGIMIEEIERLAKETEYRHGYERVRTPN